MLWGLTYVQLKISGYVARVYFRFSAMLVVSIPVLVSAAVFDDVTFGTAQLAVGIASAMMLFIVIAMTVFWSQGFRRVLRVPRPQKAGQPQPLVQRGRFSADTRGHGGRLFWERGSSKR